MDGMAMEMRDNGDGAVSSRLEHPGDLPASGMLVPVMDASHQNHGSFMRILQLQILALSRIDFKKDGIERQLECAVYEVMRQANTDSILGVKMNSDQATEVRALLEHGVRQILANASTDIGARIDDAVRERIGAYSAEAQDALNSSFQQAIDVMNTVSKRAEQNLTLLNESSSQNAAEEAYKFVVTRLNSEIDLIVAALREKIIESATSAVEERLDRVGETTVEQLRADLDHALEVRLQSSLQQTLPDIERVLNERASLAVERHLDLVGLKYVENLKSEVEQSLTKSLDFSARRLLDDMQRAVDERAIVAVDGHLDIATEIKAKELKAELERSLANSLDTSVRRVIQDVQNAVDERAIVAVNGQLSAAGNKKCEELKAELDRLLTMRLDASVRSVMNDVQRAVDARAIAAVQKHLEIAGGEKAKELTASLDRSIAANLNASVQRVIEDVRRAVDERAVIAVDEHLATITAAAAGKNRVRVDAIPDQAHVPGQGLDRVCERELDERVNAAVARVWSQHKDAMFASVKSYENLGVQIAERRCDQVLKQISDQVSAELKLAREQIASLGDHNSHFLGRTPPAPCGSQIGAEPQRELHSGQDRPAMVNGCGHHASVAKVAAELGDLVISSGRQARSPFETHVYEQVMASLHDAKSSALAIIDKAISEQQQRATALQEMQASVSRMQTAMKTIAVAGNTQKRSELSLKKQRKLARIQQELEA
ncbi:hypothetical protein PINS_up012336 [Pythium insidiosum]|nr:hypothetical protein PINS_up012336 [Pythium insidiosum]